MYYIVNFHKTLRIMNNKRIIPIKTFILILFIYDEIVMLLLYKHIYFINKNY